MHSIRDESRYNLDKMNHAIILITRQTHRHVSSAFLYSLGPKITTCIIESSTESTHQSMCDTAVGN